MCVRNKTILNNNNSSSSSSNNNNNYRVSGPGRDDPSRYIVMIGGSHLYSLTGDEVFLGVKAFFVVSDSVRES